MTGCQPKSQTLWALLEAIVSTPTPKDFAWHWSTEQRLLLIPHATFSSVSFVWKFLDYKSHCFKFWLSAPLESSSFFCNTHNPHTCTCAHTHTHTHTASLACRARFKLFLMYLFIYFLKCEKTADRTGSLSADTGPREQVDSPRLWDRLTCSHRSGQTGEAAAAAGVCWHRCTQTASGHQDLSAG